MIVTFDREPCGWVHNPFYHRRQRHNIHPFIGGLDSFFGLVLDTVTVNALSQMLQLAQCEPRREELKRKKFEIKLNVQQFASEELDVKIADNCVIVEGKHEEKKDEHGFISRHFVRRYPLPDDVKPETVVCNLSSDGLLCVSAPRLIENTKQTNERSIPVTFTGQPILEENNGEKETTNEEDEKMKYSHDGDKVENMTTSNAA